MAKGDSFEGQVGKVMKEQGINKKAAEKIVTTSELKSKKARLLKLRLAVVGMPPVRSPNKIIGGESTIPTRRENPNTPLGQKVPFGKKPSRTQNREDNFDRLNAEVNFENKRTRQTVDPRGIRPRLSPNRSEFNKIISAKKRIINLKEQRIAKEHGHAIIFKGHDRGVFHSSSLESQQGKFVKYWLLNAKQTNGNGWGIAAHTAKQNMGQFIGQPLVVTSSKWHGASIYGESFEHPYLETDNLNVIFAHQEKFRVGNIVDIHEDRNNDFFATVKMLPKFAGMILPPFCSPAIYQLDAKEADGNISKWKALHLAALDENPAYGARIALLKGTCIGTPDACKIQFKSAKFVGRPGETKKQTVKRKVGEVLDGSFIMKDGTQKTQFQQEIAQLRYRLALVTKGNTTFDRLTPEDITDVDDIEKNIKPLKGTKPTGPSSLLKRKPKGFTAQVICPKSLKARISNLKKNKKSQ